MINIKKILLTLSHERPIFHSEADFQHALAWEIQQRVPSATVRLEFRHSSLRQYLDILIKHNRKQIRIELKYKTANLKFKIHDEQFDLLYQGGQDTGRYDFLKDIQRLEKSRGLNKGYAIFLTNDKTYWDVSPNQKTIDKKFRIHEGRIVAGNLSWGSKASEGTTRGRKSKINLDGKYTCNWKDYSRVNDGLRGKFRYLLVEI